MNRNVKRYIIIILGFIITGTGSALTLKAGIGVGAWDALAKSTSDLIGIEVGTAGILFNSSCVLGQILILRKQFRLRQLLQIPFSILLGTVINFMVYHILTFPFDSFGGGIVLYLCASTLAAFGVSIVMLLDEVTFALEGFCMALTKLLPFKFSTIRQAVDVISILVIIGLTLSAHISWSIGPTLGIFMKLFKPILKRHQLLNYE